MVRWGELCGVKSGRMLGWEVMRELDVGVVGCGVITGAMLDWIVCFGVFRVGRVWDEENVARGGGKVWWLSD